MLLRRQDSTGLYGPPWSLVDCLVNQCHHLCARLLAAVTSTAYLDASLHHRPPLRVSPQACKAPAAEWAREMNKRWFRVAAVGDIPEDGTLLVKCGSEPVCLYNVSGALYATHDLCTHGEASLAEGFVFGEEIECPLHQGRFHIPTGRAIGVPCVVDLKVYPIRIEDGSVFVAGDEMANTE
jgi:naphthalene 1,2-dioxygenase ferredoxin component